MLESIPRRKVASETGTETISSQNIYGMKAAYQTSTTGPRHDEGTVHTDNGSARRNARSG